MGTQATENRGRGTSCTGSARNGTRSATYLGCCNMLPLD